MEKNLLQEFAEDLGLPLISLNFIQENKYCAIYKAQTQDRCCIVKKYKGCDPALALEEARALEFYHQVAKDDPDLIDSGEVLLRADKNLLGIGFVTGEAFSDLLYKTKRSADGKNSAIHVMEILGKLIRRMHAITSRPGEKTSPFIFDYFNYCSRNLRDISLLGFLLFRNMATDAQELAQALNASGITPSFVHGDFVFKNIHVDGSRVGLIDFANSNPASHPLNDIYNLRFALQNMLLSKAFKQDLWAAFHRGLGDLSFAEAAHHFYYEYHRRRWLWLKLSAGLVDRIQAIRGLFSFAGPFSREIMNQ